MAPHPTRDHPSPDHWLLVSDVDDTLIGDAAALDELIALLERSERLTLTVNSSRPHASVMATMETLPRGFRPCAVITALGTEVFVDGELLTAWQDRFAGFDRGPIDAAMTGLGLTPHAEEMQTPFKASFAVPESMDLERVHAALAELDVPHRTIVSHNDVDFDVIPEAAGKGAATRYLAERLGVPIEQVVVAGDSANDVLMFEAVEKAIAVGNARDELRRVADPDKTFFAARPCSGGIIEGLRHYAAPLAADRPAQAGR